MHFNYLWSIVEWRNGGIEQLGVHKSLKCGRSRGKTGFQCTCAMGVLALSLHSESTDSVIRAL